MSTQTIKRRVVLVVMEDDATGQTLLNIQFDGEGNNIFLVQADLVNALGWTMNEIHKMVPEELEQPKPKIIKAGVMPNLSKLKLVQ